MLGKPHHCELMIERSLGKSWMQMIFLGFGFTKQGGVVFRGEFGGGDCAGMRNILMGKILDFS